MATEQLGEIVIATRLEKIVRATAKVDGVHSFANRVCQIA